MATLRSRPFSTHNVLDLHTSGAGLPALKARKMVRVSCQQRLVSSGSDPRVGSPKRKSSQDAVVNMLKKASEKTQEQWWSPLFDFTAEDWSSPLSEKENIKETPNVIASSALEKQKEPPLASQQQVPHPARRSVRKPVQFTAEKARLLREDLRANETFHDKWYHSAIASKLAKPEQ